MDLYLLVKLLIKYQVLFIVYKRCPKSLGQMPQAIVRDSYRYLRYWSSKINKIKLNKAHITVCNLITALNIFITTNHTSVTVSSAVTSDQITLNSVPLKWICTLLFTFSSDLESHPSAFSLVLADTCINVDVFHGNQMNIRMLHMYDM